MMNPSPLRLGLSGTAWINDWSVLDPIQAGAAARVEFVASRDPRRAEAFAARVGVRAWGSWCELLENDEVDAVYVAAPPAAHLARCEEALEAGKHVLCEKPVADTREAAQRLIQAAAANNVILWEAMHYRWQPSVRSAVEAIRGGIFGKVGGLVVHIASPPVTSGGHRWSRPLGGGALRDVGCYAVDLTRWLLGGRLDVVVAAEVVGPTGVDSETRFTLRHSDGTRAEVVVSFEGDRYESWCRIETESSVVNLASPFHPLTPHERSLHFRVTVDGQPQPDCPSGEPVTSYYAQLEGFARACRVGATANHDHCAGDAPCRDLVEQATLIEMVSMAANRGAVG